MQRQGSFSQAEYAGKKKQMRRDKACPAELLAKLTGHNTQAGGTIPAFARTDATIIAAPPSTKNKAKVRDPETHQTKKGNQWRFGMKAHIGVDVASGVVHTLTDTAANAADINQMAALLHGAEKAVFADAGYTGADKRPELADRDVSWNIAVKRSIKKGVGALAADEFTKETSASGAEETIGRAFEPLLWN